MGLTNLQHSLSKKYSALTGELADVRLQIARIQREQAKLADLEARIPKLEALIASAALLLKDASSDWEPEHSPAVRPFSHNIPIPFGSCGRRALEIVRLADKPMTVRQIAQEVLRQAGIEQPDPKVMQQTHSAVHAALKQRKGRWVESSGKYPAQWRSVIKAGVGFDP
jgi:hypothetical protein